MNTLPCPRCGAAIDADSDRCGSCGLTADDVEAATPAGPASAPPPPLPGFPASFTVGPAPSPPARTRSRWRRAIVVLGAVAGIVLVGLVALVAVGLTLAPTEADEAIPPAEQWSSYREPAGRFQIDLPGEPRKEVLDVPLQGGSGVLDLYTYATPEAEYGIGVLQLPQGFVWESPDVVFEGMLQGFTSDGSVIVSQQRLDWAGNPAVEVALEQGDERGKAFGLLTGDRVYLITQGGLTVDDPGFQRMRDSLQLTG